MTFRTQLLSMTALALLPMTACPLAALAGDLQFQGIPYAADDAAKRAVLAATSVDVDGKDYPISYHVLARSGDRIGDGIFAALTDREGNVVRSADGSEHISADADFSSLIEQNGKLYSISHFESRPGAMYLSELSQDSDGNLKSISTKPVDFKSYGGLWVPCAGSVTPWNTHLGGEEYPSDARELEEAKSLDDVDDYDYPMARYEGLDPSTMTLGAFRNAYRPYRYGYPTEVTISADGDATAVKHFAMGRVAVELANVMPDHKTAYISDDGTNVGLFRFVADKPGDLSAGTLYAAKWHQTSDEGAGSANLTWVDLGHADDDTIRGSIEKGTQFSDIFESADFRSDGTCPARFLSSNAEGRSECLRLRDGMQVIASRLETRRYASMMGATTEFRKMEGNTYNPDHHSLYLAMSEVAKGMEDGVKDNAYDKGGRNDIHLAANDCGAVYELKLDDSYTATSMTTLVAGRPMSKADTAMAEDPSCDPAHNMCGAAAKVNTCDIDGIANPDNITYLPGYHTLVIGEDTGSGHQNDVIWSMDTDTGKLTRIFSTPYGSETTSPYWYPNIGGHGYLMAVVQHPYGESDEGKLSDPADARAYVGYIGPFPALAAPIE